MAIKEFCPHCGQSVMRHKQTLSRSLVLIFIKAAKTGLPSFHLQKDLDLTKNQYANFQKLKYWGFVSKDEFEAGKWIITSKGFNFLNGLTVEKSLWTFNNEVVDSEPGTVKIQDLKLEPFGYKQQPQYAEEAEPMDFI